MSYKDELIRDYLYENFDEEIVEEFMMFLDSVEDGIDSIISNLKDDIELINELFRIFHNLKSATSFLKIDRIKNFAHLVENVLEKLRDDPSKINDEVIDWLFLVADMFHKWYEEIDNNKILSPINPKILKFPKV